jgi:hypothetical protein
MWYLLPVTLKSGVALKAIIRVARLRPLILKRRYRDRAGVRKMKDRRCKAVPRNAQAEFFKPAA